MAITGINSENQNMRLLCEELYVGGVEFAAAQAANIALWRLHVNLLIVSPRCPA